MEGVLNMSTPSALERLRNFHLKEPFSRQTKIACLAAFVVVCVVTFVVLSLIWGAFGSVSVR